MVERLELVAREPENSVCEIVEEAADAGAAYTARFGFEVEDLTGRIRSLGAAMTGAKNGSYLTRYAAGGVAAAISIGAIHSASFRLLFAPSEHVCAPTHGAIFFFLDDTERIRHGLACDGHHQKDAARLAGQTREPGSLTQVGHVV